MKDINLNQKKNKYNTFSVGFHGDKYLLKLVDFLISKDVSHFIETGTNVGSTLSYVASNYQRLPCLSCEPEKKAYDIAKEFTNGLSNVNIYNQTSQEFVFSIKKNHPDVLKGKPLFWLDAHGYGFDWPVKEEIEFISTSFENCFILIDDFKVPDLDIFGYDVYKNQICSFDYIHKFFSHQNYSLYYPNYKEKTSSHHPLRGWGLFVIGEEISYPTDIISFINKATQ